MSRLAALATGSSRPLTTRTRRAFFRPFEHQAQPGQVRAGAGPLRLPVGHRVDGVAGGEQDDQLPGVRHLEPPGRGEPALARPGPVGERLQLTDHRHLPGLVAQVLANQQDLLRSHVNRPCCPFR